MLQQNQKRALFLPFTHAHSLADHIMENLKVKLFFLTCICYFLDRIHYRRTIDVVQGRLPWQTRGNTTGVVAYKSIPGSVWKAGFFFSRVTNRIFCGFCRSVIIIPNSNPQKSITALKVLGVDRKLIGSSNM